MGNEEGFTLILNDDNEEKFEFYIIRLYLIIINQTQKYYHHSHIQ